MVGVFEEDFCYDLVNFFVCVNYFMQVRYGIFFGLFRDVQLGLWLFVKSIFFCGGGQVLFGEVSVFLEDVVDDFFDVVVINVFGVFFFMSQILNDILVYLLLGKRRCGLF